MTRLSSVRLASSLFESAFSSRPAVAASAPGRVNLIGEHTDYNGGPVLPVALERRTAVAAAREDGWYLRLRGRWHGARDGDRRSACGGDWTDYLVGVVRELRALRAAPAGARIAVATTLPLGAGLSSSAALTVAAAKALSLLAGRRLTPAQLVDVAYRAEHDQVGVRCGRMDQTIAAHGAAGTRAPVRDGERRDATGAVSRPALGGGDRGAAPAHRRRAEPATPGVRGGAARPAGTIWPGIAHLADLSTDDLPDRRRAAAAGPGRRGRGTW